MSEEEWEGVTYDHGCSGMLQSLCAESNAKRKEVEDLSEDEIEMEGFHGEEQPASASCRPRIPSEETNDAPTSSSFPSKHAAVNLCDNSHYFEHERCTWSEIAEEANELVILYEKSRKATFTSNSEAKRARKDGKFKGKKKVSFLYQPRNRGISLFHAINGEKEGLCEDVGMPAGQDLQKSITGCSLNESLGVLQDEKSTNKDSVMPLQVEAHDRSCGYSISSLLGDLEKTTGGQSMNSRKLLLNRRKDRKFGFTGKKNFHMGSRFLENNVNLGNDISSDEDADKCQLNLVAGENREHTMVDPLNVFNDAAIVSNPLPLNRSGSDYHARLQHLLRREKDTQAEFLRQMQTKLVPIGKSSCFYVQILSRSFDARLIVCECLTCENVEELELSSEKCISTKATKKTIIFRSKICKDVDLEVGNLICIQSPCAKLKERQQKGARKDPLTSKELGHAMAWVVDLEVGEDEVFPSSGLTWEAVAEACGAEDVLQPRRSKRLNKSKVASTLAPLYFEEVSFEEIDEDKDEEDVLLFLDEEDDQF